MTTIGNLNRRLVLQEPVESADGQGGVVRSYQTVTTLWAEVRPLGGGANIAAASLGARLRYAIVVRARDDVTTRHRLVDGAHVYRVIAARLAADRRFLEVEAEEREDWDDRGNPCPLPLPPRYAPPCTPRSPPMPRSARCSGARRFYDEPPRTAEFPYVTLGETRVTDYSTGDGRGEEHQLTVHAWSRQGGHAQAHVIAGALLQVLDDAPLTVTDHQLVNFRFAVADVRREADGRTYHALVRFRAVTEPV